MQYKQLQAFLAVIEKGSFSQAATTLQVSQPSISRLIKDLQENIGFEVGEKMATYSDTGTSITSVNFPEVALPSHPDNHRILHIHENIPGVMSEINQALSENNINILGQYLQTNEDVGYVVVDVNKECSALAKEKLNTVNGTMRCRVLF